MTDGARRPPFEDRAVPVKLKLSALWAAAMFCYVYADFFMLHEPGRLARMNDGILAPFGPATPAMMLGVSVMMVIPSVMVFLALVLPPAVNRWANIVLGAAYTIIILLTMIGAPLFYLFFGTVEVVLTATVVWYGWRWPRMAAGPDVH
jgi:MFS family permease